MTPQGIINLDNPAGLTSARAVSKIKHLLAGKVKVGHAGTLDPFATGVLLVLVGKATRACEQLMGSAKTYEAVIRLGATTSTDDVDSEPIAWPDAIPPGVDAIKVALPYFVGEKLQKPPAFSALKVGGRRAYALARAGRPPDLAPRTVRIDSIEILSYDWPTLGIRVRCGRGTYIRALARDIGEKLNVGGYLTSLRRTSIGSFDISSAVTLDQLAAEGVVPHLRPIPEG
jgi:tRNA pseudouridine55 synthase